jgi:hypothetical protein
MCPLRNFDESPFRNEELLQMQLLKAKTEE